MACNAVAACRYPPLPSAPRYEPQGIRGDGPHGACRFRGLTNKKYHPRADVWSLDPDGEPVVLLMIEDVKGIGNLREILAVPGVAGILVGEGDLSQELGHPREYEHPDVLEKMAEILAVATEAAIPVGHPHVEPKNLQRVVEAGYRILRTPPKRSFANLDRAMSIVGRR